MGVGACLNCGAELSGPFCSRCGQRAGPADPTLHELGHDALSEFAGWDGKLVHTLQLLITRPGQLTKDFLDGKRARYLSPVRLYLSASVVYFVLASAMPTSSVRVSVNTGPGRTAVPLVGRTSALSDADRQAVLATIDSQPPLFRPLVRRYAESPSGFQKDVFDALPKALFALLPVFAGIVALFYRKRHFAAHLYFAIHLHTFLFAAMAVASLAAFARSTAVSAIVGIIVLVWIPVYAHRSLVRVYGGSPMSTFWKELGIGTLYAFVSMPALLILAVLVATRA